MAEKSPTRDEGKPGAVVASCLTDRRMRTRKPAPTAGAVCPVVWEGGAVRFFPIPIHKGTVSGFEPKIRRV